MLYIPVIVEMPTLVFPVRVRISGAPWRIDSPRIEFQCRGICPRTPKTVLAPRRRDPGWPDPVEYSA
jgi:hypothetical protein